MARSWMVLILIALLCLSPWRPAEAQLFGGSLVYDPTNYVANFNTYMQMIEDVQLSMKNLEKFGDFAAINAETIAQGLQVLTVVQAIAGRLMGRYGRWIAMIPVGNQIPCTIHGLLTWNKAYDTETEQSILDAGSAQTLLGAQVPMLQTLLSAIQKAAGIIGSVSGLQSLQTRLDQLVAATITLQTTKAPFQETETREKMKAQVNAKAQKILSDNRMAGLYGRPKTTCTTIAGL